MAQPSANSSIIAQGVAPSKPVAIVGEIENEAGAAKLAGAKKGAMAKGATAKGSLSKAAAAGPKTMAATGKAKVWGVALKAGAGSTVITTPGITGLAAKSAVGAGGGAIVVSKGVGLGLGLGLGLGVWGPIILGLTAAAAAYAYVRSRRAEQTQNDEELEMRQAMA